MNTINLNTGVGITRTLFPDNQPHIKITEINKNAPVEVIVSLTDSKRVLEMLMVADAIDEHHMIAERLIIPYLMAARFDRIMEHGDSFDLRVVSRMINSCNFKEVVLLDPHSDVAPALINHCTIISNHRLLQEYNMPAAVGICPDAGAAKKFHKYQQWNPRIETVVSCNKHRNLSTGNISLQVLQPEVCEGRNCVIIDDLCDGGGTFLQIAKQIKPKTLTLIVTHAIFSKGLDVLGMVFDQIIVSNSYPFQHTSDRVKVVKMF